MARTKAAATPSDPLDRDVAAVAASIVRLARHLEGEPDIAIRAVTALLDIGPFAAGPIATALKRSKSPHGKILNIAILARIGPRALVTVGRALLEVLKREKDPVVRQHAGAAHTALILADMKSRAPGIHKPTSTEAK